MIRITTVLALIIVQLLTAQSEAEKRLKSALVLWENNDTKKALQKFDSIAADYSNNWYAQYYSAYGNVVVAFALRSKPEVMKDYLNKAQLAQDKANDLAPNNVEVMVAQALINTGWILYNPMQNGQKYSGIVQLIYNKAEKLAPKNPRVVLCNAEFKMNRARYLGGDITKYCEQFKKAIKLFTTFKPQSELAPNWGMERAKSNLKKCNL